ncbi:hypothetical protein MMPV_002384 [Pyropia vietnamensis]
MCNATLGHATVVSQPPLPLTPPAVDSGGPRCPALLFHPLPPTLFCDMNAHQAVSVCRRCRGWCVLAPVAAVVAAAVVVAVVAATATATAVSTVSLAEGAVDGGGSSDGGSLAAAGVLTTVGRAACPSGKCKCKRLGVPAAVARADTILEVLVIGCGGSGYTVRINQYLKGCSRQATTAGVRSSPIALPVDRTCPPSLSVGHTYVLGLTGKRGPLGGSASGCGLVVDLSSAGAIRTLRPVYAFPRKPCNAVVNGDCSARKSGPR